MVGMTFDHTVENKAHEIFKKRPSSLFASLKGENLNFSLSKKEVIKTTFSPFGSDLRVVFKEAIQCTLG